MEATGREIIQGAAWVAIETWGRQLAMFVVFVVLARNLDPEAFGLAALAMVMPTIVAVPVTRGIPEALIQRPDVECIHFDSAFWLLAVTGSAFSGLVWTFAGAIAAAFSQPVLEDLVRWTSVVIVLQALAAVPAAILKRQLHFRLFALRTLAGTVVGGTIGIGTAIAGHGMWSLVWMQVAKAAVETAVILLGSAWRPHLRYSHARCRELFGFAGPLIGHSLWNFVNDEIPKVILGTFLGPYAVGVYALARRPLDLLSEAFLGPLTAVTIPAVARVQSEPAKIDAFFNSSIRVAAIAGFPAFLGFAAIAPVAVPFIFGPQWVSGVVAVQILMLLGLQRTIDSICALTILALGHSGLILKLNISETVLAVILLTAAVQVDLETTMAALLACNVLLLPVFLFLVHHLAHIDVLKPLRIFPRLAVAGLLMFAVVTAWLVAAPASTSQGLLIAGGIIVGAAVYVAAVIVLVRPDLLNARDMLLRVRRPA
ncbi:lipopolysaccharide biosynthesis protein [Mesorhizobium sp.]|uniref:lipopolysaccharide biosynthesis protein n=1 Tax=Mesorhizobium sp. TaxID=1871066 RepID=UPI000FE3B44E|nr:lipopolysaccharide biosynthesis protein [Mesorhizobium sp.]RWN54320.1 MAG: lipopolysaccharide biosynthesis protein [Mesorhizobium sp.]RWN79421.1 MAG: lipopolysaccharide biosynthesis protein [Mesorhizobium sp.]RWN84979.1 MAG: lipopolysaccharide biosynthesis protein [Mesorhizobium sp.]RWN93098.1 MAG: lipopolysaccharide biosynthesis protein [Mesorhizobium sp.]RWO17098.1 MAG: lipopolysaccharide biosynthesis protein [Mesorhizobium sp.]